MPKEVGTHNPMKTRMNLWTPLQAGLSPNEYVGGQKLRPCIIIYAVNGLGAKSLYSVTSITDAYTDQVYDVDATLPLNEDMDHLIVKSSPTQVAFARVELGMDVKKPMKKKPIQKPEPKNDDDLLFDL